MQVLLALEAVVGGCTLIVFIFIFICMQRAMFNFVGNHTVNSITPFLVSRLCYGAPPPVVCYIYQLFSWLECKKKKLQKYFFSLSFSQEGIVSLTSSLCILKIRVPLSQCLGFFFYFSNNWGSSHKGVVRPTYSEQFGGAHANCRVGDHNPKLIDHCPCK
jgi:hypothetical protein